MGWGYKRISAKRDADARLQMHAHGGILIIHQKRTDRKAKKWTLRTFYFFLRWPSSALLSYAFFFFVLFCFFSWGFSNTFLIGHKKSVVTADRVWWLWRRTRPKGEYMTAFFCAQSRAWETFRFWPLPPPLSLLIHRATNFFLSFLLNSQNFCFIFISSSSSSSSEAPRPDSVTSWRISLPLFLSAFFWPPCRNLYEQFPTPPPVRPSVPSLPSSLPPESELPYDAIRIERNMDSPLIVLSQVHWRRWPELQACVTVYVTPAATIAFTNAVSRVSKRTYIRCNNI